MTASPCPPHASATSLRRRVGRALALLGLASAVAWSAACSSTPRAQDACSQIEGARCAKLATSACGGLPGDPDGQSCARFYAVQCDRGLADDATEPSAAALSKCLATIAESCDVARAPETYLECAFLSTTTPPEAGLDTGTDASDADASGDASDAGDAADASDTANDATGEASADSAADAGSDAADSTGAADAADTNEAG